MELRIRDSSQIIDVDFGTWLINRIKIKLVSNFKNYNFESWENYINKSDSIRRLYSKKYSCYDLICFSANNLVCVSVPGELVIKFNNAKTVPGFDRLLLTTIIKTINYGTLEMKGCPIFTDTFKDFENNISTYVKIYYDV